MDEQRDRETRPDDDQPNRRNQKEHSSDSLRPAPRDSADDRDSSLGEDDMEDLEDDLEDSEREED
jgi:hypothetical protein